MARYCNPRRRGKGGKGVEMGVVNVVVVRKEKERDKEVKGFSQ
jgi:hypothetical protein